MSSGGLFSFRPELGETPEILERRRKVAEAMLASAAGQPATTIGGGLAALGQAIGGRLALGRVNRATAAGQAGAAGLFGDLFGGGGAAAPGETAAIPGTEPVSGTGTPDVSAMEAYIREKAPTYGVDPDIAVKVARSEGLQPGTWQSNVMGKKGRETSYGPFQLLVGGGLGDEFQRTTGLNAADPSTWQQQIDFALGQAAKGGWSPWYGAAKVGVGPRTGIGGAPAVTAALTGTEPVSSADPAALAAAGMGGFDFTPFATGGAAARPDSFSGLQPQMSSGLQAMISSAPPDIQKELRVMSAFRSPETQETLWRNAVKKYGSESAARKWVAPPGRSQHGRGNAIDWKFASKAARDWAHRNAAKFGFSFPLAHEPWHMEVAGARGSRGGPPVRQNAVRIGPGAALLAQSNRGQGGGLSGGLPAVMEALTGPGPRQEQINSTDPAAVLAATGMIDPAAKDDMLQAPLPFRPAGGPTPYSAGSTVLGAGSANAGTLTPVPDPNMRPAIAPIAPTVPPTEAPVAPGAPVATGVAPVARALGYDPLPQATGYFDPVSRAGSERLEPSRMAVAAALGGGGGTDALVGGGGRGFLGRLFGGRGAATPVAAVPPAGGGGVVPPATATGETAALPGTEPVAGVPPASTGGLSPMAQRAIAVIQNPWSNAGQIAVAKAMLEQEIQQADPKYRLELEKIRFDLEQARNPPKSRDLTPQEVADRGYNPDRRYRETPTGEISEVPGTKRETIKHENLIVDANTGELIATIPDPGYRAATPEEAAKYGAAAGQFDLSNNKFEPINPPTGFSVTVGPDGTVSLTQGPGAGKGLTEAQSKDTVYVTRAEGSLPTLDTYGDALLSFPMRMAENDPTGFFRSMQSPEFQLAYGAGLEFLQAILRKDTAAAITPAETVEYGRVYLPEPGDGPERLEYKRQARRRAVEAIKAGLPPDAILRLETASDVIKEKTGTTGEVIEVPETPSTKVPEVGAVEDGFRFKGGDPSDSANWEKVD